jgi:hypothetical protein
MNLIFTLYIMVYFGCAAVLQRNGDPQDLIDAFNGIGKLFKINISYAFPCLLPNTYNKKMVQLHDVFLPALIEKLIGQIKLRRRGSFSATLLCNSLERIHFQSLPCPRSGFGCFPDFLSENPLNLLRSSG